MSTKNRTSKNYVQIVNDEFQIQVFTYSHHSTMQERELLLAEDADWPCGKRLAAIKTLWLPHFEDAYGKLLLEIKEQLESISAAQIDRLLAPYKSSI